MTGFHTKHLRSAAFFLFSLLQTPAVITALKHTSIVTSTEELKFFFDYTLPLSKITGLENKRLPSARFKGFILWGDFFGRHF